MSWYKWAPANLQKKYWHRSEPLPAAMAPGVRRGVPVGAVPNRLLHRIPNHLPMGIYASTITEPR
jgi:hypothetical protein